MTVKIVSKPKMRSEQHVCDLPKWRLRRKMAVRLFTIIQCEDCQTRYQWLRGPLELGAHWEAIR